MSAEMKIVRNKTLQTDWEMTMKKSINIALTIFVATLCLSPLARTESLGEELREEELQIRYDSFIDLGMTNAVDGESAWGVIGFTAIKMEFDGQLFLLRNGELEAGYICERLALARPELGLRSDQQGAYGTRQAKLTDTLTSYFNLTKPTVAIDSDGGAWSFWMIDLPAAETLENVHCLTSR